ncbi:MAG: pimelyl-ACP methyl ester esterase BioV [Arcobacteraceae bacterium]|nr:pimelyl-ACP methyl ester esterase BioV [Arcobacteraceae bacterium]
MRYYSGFCLQNEQELFNENIIKSDFCISGFSYGAIKAVEYALNSDERIDKLQLFSPAFFNNKDDKYKRMQLMFFTKDKTSYINNFLQNVAYPKELDLSLYLHEGTFDELKELLYYEWKRDAIQSLINKGIFIEVYLGADDKIIDSALARNFFKDCGCEVYFIKNRGHVL